MAAVAMVCYCTSSSLIYLLWYYDYGLYTSEQLKVQWSEQRVQSLKLMNQPFLSRINHKTIQHSEKQLLVNIKFAASTCVFVAVNKLH